jgi:hypothetical protein
VPVCISVDKTKVRSIDRYILGLNRYIDVRAEMSRRCKHSSMAKTCAIFAYLILSCSKCHDIFNHEASQSNYGTCSSAAGDRAECLYSELPMLKSYNSTAPNWYQTISEWHYHISARKPRQLWLQWYALHRDPSLDGSP